MTMISKSLPEYEPRSKYVCKGKVMVDRMRAVGVSNYGVWLVLGHR
jgi:hypothetical protein